VGGGWKKEKHRGSEKETKKKLNLLEVGRGVVTFSQNEQNQLE